MLLINLFFVSVSCQSQCVTEREGGNNGWMEEMRGRKGRSNGRREKEREQGMEEVRKEGLMERRTGG